MSALLELRDVSVKYDAEHALKNITLTINHGERVALVGRSGAGKSTLLRVLYEQNGMDAALVPQDFGLVRTLSVFHNVYMGRLRQHSAFYNLANLVKPLRREIGAIMPVLERVEMAPKIFEPTGQLSGGQQQRTAIARALHQCSDVVMADEPVSSVDEHQSRRVLDALVEGHRTAVLAMHDLELALTYANRIIGLQDGRITLDESTDGMSAKDLDGLYGN
jgi:phosphonate transport system ATP-binding protein